MDNMKTDFLTIKVKITLLRKQYNDSSARLTSSRESSFPERDYT